MKTPLLFAAISKATSAATALALGALGLAATAATPALAQDLIFENVRAVGGGDGERCRLDPATGEGNLLFVDNGAQVSFIFSTFGINLPRSRSPFSGVLAWSASCNVEADIIIPQGYFVRTLSQSIVGGVLKDSGTTGGISTNAFLFQNQIPLNQINMAFRPEEKILNALVSRENTQVFLPAQTAIMCAATAAGPMRTKFKFQMLAAGAKPLPFLNFVANIDGSDLVYGVESSLGRCL
jgi:hypothetical protein